jgi:hypothetical protein
VHALVRGPLPLKDGAILPLHDAAAVPLPVLKVAEVLATLELAAWTHDAQVVLDLAVLAGTAVVEVALVLVLIAEVDLAHVIETPVPEGACLSHALLSDSGLKAVAEAVFVDAVAIGLVVYELAYQCARVSEDHLALADPLVAEELPLVHVSIAEVVHASAASLPIPELPLVEVSVGVLPQ